MQPLMATDPIRHLTGDPVATILPSSTLRDAATELAADGIGLLVVVDPSGVRGVLSERDIVRAIAEGIDLDVERVRDVASLDVQSVDENTSILDTARRMIDAEIRHIAVSRRDVVYDVVSIRDVLNVLVNDAAPASAAGR
ncbi:MAG: CBS domain-containing protein [Nitriliruptoraceae bacterium]